MQSLETFESEDRDVFLAVKRMPGDKGSVATSGDWSIAFSGYLLNRETITRRLGLSASESDAKLALSSFIENGDWSAKHLDGLFSAAVWNSHTRSLYVFSDRVGGAHGIYFTNTPDGFFFSSRLPALTTVNGLQRRIDRDALAELFSTGYILPPRSLMEGVSKTWPGQRIRYRRGETKKEMPCTPVLGETPCVTDGSAEQFESALLHAAALRTNGQMPECGWLLSGGVDSSTLVGMASGVDRSPLKTFSACFPGTEFDEGPYAKIVADAYHCNARFIDMSSSATFGLLRRIIWELDEPFLDYSAVPTFRLFREVSKHVDAVVSGDGPDHLLGRYYPLAAKCSLHRWSGLLQLAASLTGHSTLRKFATIAGGNLRNAYRTLFDYPAWGRNPAIWKHLLTNPCDRDAFELDSDLALDLTTSGDFDRLLAKLIRVDSLIDGSFGVFMKVGKMARANGLAVHWPFLDRSAIGAAHSLPRELLVPGNFADLLRDKCGAKHVLRCKIAPKYLSKDVLEKPKGGFTPPMGSWLRDHIQGLAGKPLLSPQLCDAGLFQLEFVAKMAKEHAEGTREWTTILFMLLSVDHWFNMFIANACLEPPGDVGECD